MANGLKQIALTSTNTAIQKMQQERHHTIFQVLLFTVSQRLLCGIPSAYLPVLAQLAGQHTRAIKSYCQYPPMQDKIRTQANRRKRICSRYPGHTLYNNRRLFIANTIKAPEYLFQLLEPALIIHLILAFSAAKASISKPKAYKNGHFKLLFLEKPCKNISASMRYVNLSVKKLSKKI